MAKIKDPQDAFTTKIKALYDIENEIIKALPKMEKAATDEKLKDGFRKHLATTERQAERLEQIFDQLGEKPSKTKCEGIRGIIEDGEWVASTEAPAEIRDAMIADAARHVEHYEMAAYSGAIAEAEMLGLNDALPLLQDTLREEEQTDRQLAQAAEMNLSKVMV